MERVVITGMGAITPIGIGTEDYWNALVAGESGVKEITAFDASDYTTQIAAEVRDFPIEEFMPKKEAKRTDRFTQFAVAASRLAFEQAKLTVTEDNADNIGVIIGSGIGGLHTIEETHKKLLESGPRKVSPFFIPMLISNMASGHVSIDLGVRGPNLSINTACATATHAIGEAFRLLQRGDEDVMIAGGTEATITPLAVAGFGAAKALSTRNDEPQRASRPFDADRDGFVMGEGAGILILEKLSHAQKRNAPIYGEVIGFGMTGDAYHITAPSPDAKGVIRCMQEALKDASLKPGDVDYINAHGTSTEFNDKLETLAIREVFGEHAYELAVNSTKSMTGHLLGAAGGVEAIATVKTIQENYLHPTINLETPDPECDLDYVPNEGRPSRVNTAIINSLGFGGTNACLALKNYEE